MICFSPVLPLVTLCSVFLISCQQRLYPNKQAFADVSAEKISSADSGVANVHSVYRPGIDTTFNSVIGHTDVPLTKAQPECTLGNLVADAQLLAAKKIDSKVVGSVINYGAIRLDYIPPGAITKGRIHELLPYNNTITIIEVSGEVLKRFCDHMIHYKGWPLSGITYTIKNSEATGIMVNGEQLNEHLIYKIAVNDYIANGGNGCDFLKPLKKKFTNVLARDAVIDYIVQLEQQDIGLHPVVEKRIQYAE